jgi:sulfate/thiosulfate transport system substrate-binding protein
VAFLVRHGNPKKIKDWADLALANRAVVTSDPKACGGGRWNYAAAWGLGTDASEPAKRRGYLSGFLRNVPTFYANQGEAGEAFLKGGNGDVLLTYESFALGITAKPDAGVELVVPPRTVEIELPVAVVRKITKLNKTTKLAEAYLRGLYDPEAQVLLAKHYFRPRLKGAAKKAGHTFPAVTLLPARALFDSDAEARHLSDGGTFDALRTRGSETQWP